MITKIIYNWPDNIDESSEDCAAARQWLTEQLEEKYPTAVVRVTSSHGPLVVVTDDGTNQRYDVLIFINECADHYYSLRYEDEPRHGTEMIKKSLWSYTPPRKPTMGAGGLMVTAIIVLGMAAMFMLLIYNTVPGVAEHVQKLIE